MKPAEDLEKLPKWARHRITRLERDVAYWREKAEAPATGDGSQPGSPRIRDACEVGRDIALSSTAVTYTVGGFDVLCSVAWSNNLCKGDPDAVSVSSWAGRLDIEPRASNLIHVRVRR